MQIPWDCSVKPNKDQMELFIKSQREEGKLLLSYQNIKCCKVIANVLYGYTHLILSHNLLNSGLLHLAARINKSQLIHLDLSNNNLKIAPFLDHLNSRTLISLNICSIRLNLQDIKSLCRIVGSLQFLWLNNTQLNNIKYSVLEQYLIESEIIYLDLSGNSIVIRKISNNLQYLNIHSCQMSEINFKLLELEILNISNNPFTQQAQLNLCYLLNGSKINKLIMDNIKIDDLFIYKFKSSVVTLSLQNCNLHKINPLIHNNRNLKHLNLSNNCRIEQPHLNLESIQLDRCFYNEEIVCNIFTQLYQNKVLQWISIKDTYINLRCLEIISNLLGINRVLCRIDTTCDLGSQIKYKLKLNQKKNLYVSINSSRIDSQHCERDSIDQHSELILNKKILLEKQLNEKQQNLMQFKENQYQLTKQMKEQLDNLFDYDLQLNKDIDDIEKQKLRWQVQVEADIMFYYKNIQQFKKDQQEMRNNLQIRQEQMSQYRKQIILLENQAILQQMLLEQAKEQQKKSTQFK